MARVAGMRWRLPAHPVDVLGAATKRGFGRRNGGIWVLPSCSPSSFQLWMTLAAISRRGSKQNTGLVRAVAPTALGSMFHDGNVGWALAHHRHLSVCIDPDRRAVGLSPPYSSSASRKGVEVGWVGFINPAKGIPRQERWVEEANPAYGTSFRNLAFAAQQLQR